LGLINKLLGLKSLRQQLSFWISSMIILLAITITISFSYIGLRHAQRTALESMEETLTVQNIYIEKWFEERAANIRNLANMTSSRTYDRDRIEHNLKFALESIKEFDTIHFIDLTGHIVISTVDNIAVTDMSDREYFKEALKGNEFITDVLFGRGTHRFIIVFSSPVFDYNNNVIGTIIGSVNLGSIDKIIEDIETLPGKDIYIVDSEGYMITESKFLDELIKKGMVEETSRMNIQINSELYKKAINGNIQTNSYYDYRGEEVFGTYRWTNNGKWLIISEIDKSELMKGLHHQLFSVIASLVLILALSIFIALRFTKRIEGPINHLIKSSTVIQGGNYKHRVDQDVVSAGPEELVILCNAFNEMSATIDSHMITVQESEQKYKALMDHNPDMVFSLDDEGKIQEINSVVTRILGYETDEVIGQHFTPFIEPEDLEKTIKYFGQAIRGIANNFEILLMAKDKNPLLFSITLFPIITNKEIKGVYGIGKDITQVKLAEATLIEYSKKLEQSNKDLQQFAYIASHDLQEPLRMVTSYLQLLEKRYKTSLDQDAHEFIDFAVDGAKRMQKLIRDLLNYSRINTQGNEFKAVDSQEIFEQVLDNLEFKIKEKDVEISSDPLPVVHGDETQLIQLLQNLIANSIKFNDKKKCSIHISAEKRALNWIFSVRDNGIGIPKQYEERIFTIFQRLHTRDEYEGTGIGLAICKRIVERHGGTIWFESREGEGSTFNFTVPIAGGKNNE
jgi:PAS domain S-box-containing protein